MIVRALVGVAVSLIACWVVFLAVLAVARPRGFDLREARAFVPDVVQLVRNLARDGAVPKGVRRRLLVLGVYLALPFDIVPDFIPLLGYADDVIVIGLVLRSVVRRAGADALARHWRGSEQGFALVRRIAGVASPP